MLLCQVETIPLWRLGVSLLPALAVLVVLWRWRLDTRTSMLALGRMLLQLLIVGYVLAALFQAEHSALVLATLLTMTIAASWISLRTVADRRRQLMWIAVVSIGVCGIATLFLISVGVLGLTPWFRPDKLIPLGGMVLSSCMNTVSLAAERFESEVRDGKQIDVARSIAMQTALIPVTNSLLAVGLVSFPGMMTGQVLAGVSPLIAVRYQVMVMCMTFGGSGLATATFLALLHRQTPEHECQPSGDGTVD